MDRRQQKTRTAIYRAFTTLLDRQNFHSITVQDIIDEANIGRSTFYAHFETKEELVKSLCRELFDHIIGTAMDKQDTHGLYACTNAPHSVICHILQHLQENDNNILTLLSCESSPIFMSYFKSGMEELVRSQLLGDTTSCSMCRRLVINAGLKEVVIRRTATAFDVVDVADWVAEDDLLASRDADAILDRQ